MCATKIVYTVAIGLKDLALLSAMIIPAHRYVELGATASPIIEVG
jgi:hypothetical protein